MFYTKIVGILNAFEPVDFLSPELTIELLSMYRPKTVAKGAVL